MEQDMQSQNTPVEITSFATRAVNVLTAPGELFAEVSSAPVQGSSWLIPYFIMVALVALTMFAFTNNPVLYDQMLQPQREALAKGVAEGSMTQQQADQAAQFTANKGLFIAIGIFLGVLYMSAIMFGAPLALWIASKSLWKFNGGYRKILEIYGLANVVGIVGTLVAVIMMVMMESMYAQPSGAFFLRDSYQPGNFMHNVAASMNIFSIWQIGVVGIGLSAVSGKGRGAGIGLAFGLWLVYVVAASLLGWGAR
jgi:hypothetical protein